MVYDACMSRSLSIWSSLENHFNLVPLSHSPFRFLLLAYIIPTPCLFVVKPSSFIPNSVWPLKNSIALPFVFIKFTFILLAIAPIERPFAMHLIILKLAFIPTTIRPLIYAKAILRIIFPVTFINRLIFPFKPSVSAMLLTFHKAAFIFRAVSFSFDPLAVL